MIHSGMVSVSFRNLDHQQIISLAAQVGLEGIEWGGDIHVPHGAAAHARQVGQDTRAAGLQVAAYGSYYRVGVSEAQGLSFAQVLDSAVALETGLIRVWAGAQDADRADEAYWRTIVEDSRRIAALAADHGLTLVYEFHDGTLTHRYDSCRRLLEQVDRPNVKTYWQPIHGWGPQRNGAGLKTLLPWLFGVHVFHWWPDHTQRHLLDAGREDWQEYFQVVRTCGRDLFALLEFAKDDSVDHFKQDAQTLRGLL